MKLLKYQRLERLDSVTTHMMRNSTNNSVEIHGIHSSGVRFKGNVSNADHLARAPLLDISVGNEVTVVNGDRSNLTWKRYKLISIMERSGVCIVQSLVDSRQRTFPRSVVKPKVLGLRCALSILPQIRRLSICT